MVDLHDPTAVLDDHLDRDRTRSRQDLTYEPGCHGNRLSSHTVLSAQPTTYRPAKAQVSALPSPDLNEVARVRPDYPSPHQRFEEFAGT